MQGFATNSSVRRRGRPRGAALALALALTGGCRGIVGEVGQGGGDEPPSSGSGGRRDPSPSSPSSPAPGAGGQGGTPGPGPAGALCTASELAARTGAPGTRLRRLTNREIRSTTTLLFDQMASAALANLDADSQPEGSFSRSDQLMVSDSFANSLNLAAETIGTRFKTTVTRAAYGDACFTTDAQAETCAKTFIRSFGAKAFRRAITDADVTGLFAVYQAGREVGTTGDAGDRFATGLSWVVRAMVQSPHFLYLTELGDPAAKTGATTTLLPEEVASALSYALLGMPPDDALRTAAGQNQLGTGEQRAAQAQRLIAAYPDRWKEQMRLFVPEWLGINFSRPEWAKDTKVVPLYTASLKAALQTETDMFIDDWATAPEGARLDTLLTTPSTFVNAATAPLYGAKAAGAAFTKVALDPAQRAGLLTLAGFLGSTSHVNETSPVVRGKVILQKFLCKEPPPPPPMVPPLPPPDRSAPTTTRARFDVHLTSPACKSCHQVFEPMGDAFERYDALGAYRTEQNGHPVDSAGALVGATGGDRPVADAVALVKLLAQSPDTFACVARQAYRFTLGKSESDYDRCTLAKASQALGQAPFDVRALMISIVGSDSFVVRTVNQ
jgi:hypothetical protein